jgi:hypothetical protein
MQKQRIALNDKALGLKKVKNELLNEMIFIDKKMLNVQ